MRIDFTCCLCLCDALREWDTPFPENGLETFAQQVALRAGLKAEVTNQAAAAPFCALQYSGDDVEITPEPLSPGKRLIVQGFAHQALVISKVTVEHFLGESFLGLEMIGKGAVWCTGSGADIADASCLVTGLQHYLQPGIKDIFAKGRFGHGAYNTFVRILPSRVGFCTAAWRMPCSRARGSLSGSP